MPPTAETSLGEPPSKGAVGTEWHRAGQRLAGELRALLAAVPSSVTSARAMSALLSVDRNICQKALAASRVPDQRALVMAPGPRSLRELADAVERAGIAGELIAGVRAAIDGLEECILASGGTHRALKQAVLGETGPAPGGGDAGGGTEGGSAGALLRQRRQHFEASARTLGLRVDLMVAASIFSTVEGPEGARLTLTGVQAQLGCGGSPGCLPMAVNVERIADGQKGRYEGIRSRLVDGLTTPGLPLLSRRRPSETSVDVIDLGHVSLAGRRVDIVVQTDVPPSASSLAPQDQALSMYLRVRQPTARLVGDIFVERRLAAGRLPAAGAFLWNVRVDRAEATGQWYDMLPGATKIEVLGTGLEAVDDAIWARQRELYERLFADAGLDPEGFIGYRVDVAFPMTGAQYRLALESLIEGD